MSCWPGIQSQFQSLGWVERLSDVNPLPAPHQLHKFQSLGWVERLSDAIFASTPAVTIEFQSLGWVERLSDAPDDDGAGVEIVVSIPRMG